MFSGLSSENATDSPQPTAAGNRIQPKAGETTDEKRRPQAGGMGVKQGKTGTEKAKKGGVKPFGKQKKWLKIDFLGGFMFVSSQSPHRLNCT